MSELTAIDAIVFPTEGHWEFIDFITRKCGQWSITAFLNPKVELYKTIKELEARLAPTANGKAIVFNSFIMSGTRSLDLNMCGAHLKWMRIVPL